MHSPVGHQWIMILLATVILRAVCYQELSAGDGPVRVEISADESLRDRSMYIIRFKDHTTEEELQQFVATLSRSFEDDKSFVTEIIEELFIIKCLIARLSTIALMWVRTVCIF